MTTREARELHNPFIREGKLCREAQVNCKSFSPDLSLLKREAVMLTFPNQEWIDLVSKVHVEEPQSKTGIQRFLNCDAY